MHKGVVLLLIFFFLMVQLIGLSIADFFIKENVRAKILTDNPDDVSNALALLLYMLFFTLIFIIIISFIKVRGVTMLFEIFSLLLTSIILFEIFLPEVVLLFPLVIVAVRVLFKENIIIKNTSSLISTAVVGALIGVSLGVLPIVFLLAALCVYDYIAVFKTKHMVKMAEAIARDNTAFTFSLPSKEKIYQLGTGDLVLPLVFSTAVLRKAKAAYVAPYYFIPVFVIFIASLLGLSLTFCYLFKKKQALPALPLQGLFMLAAWLGMVFGGLPLI
ncbi:MAG: presenilin family intramembrane aspartyl protease [Candidatus Diapherotrites archaeon]|nr:presenilin family intramembrane aspartyl protease [Candidatus Diapherotrites archaeon]